ncbi:IS200/IS605 family transposase [Aliifodinibius sp. S!AR15-10]|uniref:IS200/IS605 family transposase n=1 Tax=Aliifodinibius sp. S!AR15-10 TaxID=2950437 RepID=UPI00285A520A|nr:IS200/IS605 family transposase [Aliifodinibius sp. S!AR15-10]MDR8393527.1 IS200/IS605 family transposase [Aliifodinibius sp. S!AR15-10]
MGSTFSKIYIHLVFSTKNREPVIHPDYEKRLTAYITQIAEKHDLKLLVMNGTQNHVHLLVVIPPSVPISEAVKHIKGGSSNWLNKNFFEAKDFKFRWQKGYGAFSVNESMVPATIRYINQQKKHHNNMSYEQELDAILDKHGLN